jgi:hypothetical protein
MTDFGYAIEGDFAYVVGGSNEVFGLSNAVYEYNILSNIWTTLSLAYPMPLTGSACSGGGDGFIYCFGGSDAAGTFSTYAAKYAVGSNAGWTPIAALPVGIAYAGTALVDGTIFIAGGWLNVATVYAYDIANNSYTMAGSLLNGRQRVGLAHGGGMLWVAGGGNEWAPIAQDESFDGTAWAATGTSMNTPMLGSLVAYIDGYGIFFVGGRDAATVDHNDNQLWTICAPFFESVSPADVPEGTTPTLTITGNQFDPNATVWLRDVSQTVYQLSNQTVTSATEIVGDLPAGIPAGTYGLIIEGLLGQITSADDAFVVTEVAGDDDDATDDDDDVTGDDDDSTDDDDTADDDDTTGSDDEDADDDSGCCG